ncbi:MAG: DUF4214 domain-containing protein, partial [Clostridiales bacterium]|nr:DUF4214 domain-containing protein [Clostridiales bacterium]
PMVVVCPHITKTVEWGTKDFQGFVDNGYFDELLKNIKNNTDGDWGKVDWSKPITVAGYSMGGAEALYIGTKFNGTDAKKDVEIYNVGAFSPALTYYYEGGGWISSSSGVVFSQRTDGHFFMCYGDGEEKNNFDANVTRYLNAVKNNGKNIPDRFKSRVYSADFGPHGWRVFELGTFDYLYYLKFGSLPSEEITCNACWGKVTISGTTSVGNTLTASCISYYYKNFKYQWYRVDASTGAETKINGATSSSYTLTSSDAGYKIRCRIQTTDTSPDPVGYTYKTTDVITSSQQSQTAITGTVNLSTTTVRYGISVQATPSNSNATSYKYQWMRNDSAISGATSDWYQITKDDIGNQLSCVISDKNGKYTGTISSSKYKVLKACGPATPSVTGVDCSSKGAKDGKIQNVSDKMEYAVVTSSGPSSYTSCTGNTVTGLSAGTYYVRIKETASTESSGVATVVIGEKNTTPQKAITGTVTLSTFDVRYGDEVSASVTGSNATNLKYQWKRGNAVISGATSSKYTIQKDDIGTNITCVVSDKDGKLTGTISSKSTMKVLKAASPAAPSITKTDCDKGSSNGKISGVSTKMEYAAGSKDGSYKACTGTEITGLAAGTYYVRMMETDTTEAGQIATVSISEKEGQTTPSDPSTPSTPSDPTPSDPTPSDPTPSNPDNDRSTSSKELITRFINNVYQSVLGRDAEPEGAAYWFDELWNFRNSGDELALRFLDSQEFKNRALSDEDYVKVLYKAFFDRDPDDEGLNYWLNALSTKTLDRKQVANSFVYSQEWADTCATYGIRCGGNVTANVDIKPSDSVYAFVERMYTTALKRESDPTGKEFWANDLSNYRCTGEQIGLQFFICKEMNDLNLSNEEFVERLYLTFMDRASDTTGKEFWVKNLKDGASRESVVLGFTRSEEFTERCINDRILPF